MGQDGMRGGNVLKRLLDETLIVYNLVDEGAGGDKVKLVPVGPVVGHVGPVVLDIGGVELEVLRRSRAGEWSGRVAGRCSGRDKTTVPWHLRGV